MVKNEIKTHKNSVRFFIFFAVTGGQKKKHKNNMKNVNVRTTLKELTKSVFLKSLAKKQKLFFILFFNLRKIKNKKRNKII